MTVDTILGLGDDQKSSQFRIIFPTGIPFGGDAERLALRADQGFTPAEKSVAKYEIWREGRKIEKTSNVEETDKTFSLDFRVDQKWGLYDDLEAWWQAVCGDDGTAQNDADTRTQMIVQYMNTNKKVMKEIKYYGVKLVSFVVSEANHSSSDPIRVTCGFIYIKQKG